MMRPQFGSDPATAVFTSGELAMARAMRTAASSLGAPVTWMVMSFFAPSPSRAIMRASVSMTCATPSSTASNSFGSGRTPDAPFASSTSVSLVDVSPSTDIRL